MIIKKNLPRTIFFFLCQLVLAVSTVFSQFSDPPKSIPSADPVEECTIGIASGRATKDGRPMIWKTRDTGERNNAVILNTKSIYKYLAVVDAGSHTSSWMSLNEKGFAIINSALYDLPSGSTGLSNGTIMAYAAGRCITVRDFQRILDSTNISGRSTCGNFGVMDSDGAAAFFEVGGTQYWKYDAGDTVTCKEGYILRTNFSLAGKGSTGLTRYDRTTALFKTFFAGDSISPFTIIRHQMRDFADGAGVPFALPFKSRIGTAPFGYIPTDNTICRNLSTSASVIQGILPGEPVTSSTFWTILGMPATGIAVPYWPVGETPMNSIDNPTAPLCDAAGEIYTKIMGTGMYGSYINTAQLRFDNGNGLLKNLYITEDKIFASADSLVTQWRAGKCGITEVLAAESAFAAIAFAGVKNAKNNLLGGIAENYTSFPNNFELSQNYPNPFNPTTVFRYSLPSSAKVTLKIYTLLGQQVGELVKEEQSAGVKELLWNASHLSSGVYLYALTAVQNGVVWSDVKKCVVMK